MDADSILAKLDHVLEEERAAIRSLDGARVETCAAEKVALVTGLTKLDPKQRARVAPRLKVLAGKLRHNGILLVHARGILTDVLRLRGAIMNPNLSRIARPPALPAGARLSIRG
jgi:hypothetical protein